MTNFSYIKPKDYKKELSNKIWSDIYRKLQWDKSYVVEMDNFQDRTKAIKVIKNFMDNGAYIFCHFTSDYNKLVVFRSDSTDKYIQKVKKEEKEAKKNRDGKEKQS